MYKQILDRFWAKVDKRESNECWLWTGAKISTGYGKFKVYNGRVVRAHRFAYEMKFGKIEGNLYCCHSCDTPSCVNPSHLFLGTQHDNIHDAMKKDRLDNKGENNGRSKLTEQKVQEIRQRLRTGLELQKEIARDFGVTAVQISHINLRKSWAWLT